MKKILTYILVAFVALTVVSCKKDPGPSKLVGDVTYRDNQIPGVEVTLTSENDVLKYTTITDGYFLFENIPAGTYDVSCSYKGKAVDSYLKNYEKSDTPKSIIILPGTLHTRNIIIPSTEILDLDD
ncbi:MAG: carboxypeptidase regulatory-like domain-containing protein [Bacteroidales bacterium]|nr:carboxypeptidase regulatory-like domain-containing protein [Bacteroidales bacterium]